ncbi:MAG: SpoIID/LytB domain-containing protein [Gaiellaceae bacterium]
MVLFAAFATVLSLLVAGGSGARADVEPASVLTLSVSGRGWGHGVGMSQWGAYGFAQRGSTYDQILAHYYSGTELVKGAGTRVRVLLVESAASALIGSFSSFVAEDSAGERRELEAASYRIGPELELGGAPLTPPVTLTAQGDPLLLNGAAYRGTVQLTVQNNRLRVINTLPLEQYLLGVVPREVPSDWPVEALKAQAVAARSYAVATRKTNADFDVYADTRSQVYGGIGAEAGTTTAAVQATAREVLRYEGRIATTYFFSTSGGRTADITEVWGSQPVPYLVSVPDPYDSASPYHRWGPVAVPSAKLKRVLKLPSAPVDARVMASRSGWATQLVLTLADGSETSVPAGTVRSALELRSSWFRTGLLSLRPPDKTPAVFGTKARVAGFVRGVGGVTLERRALGGAWEPVTAVAKGEFAVPFRAEQTADYRLVTSKLKGAPLRVQVAPRVTLKEPFRGTVRPVLPGAIVVVQRREGARWVSAATATVDEQGAYEVSLEPAPGTYRVRLAPGSGFAVGISRTLSVSG